MLRLLITSSVATILLLTTAAGQALPITPPGKVVLFNGRDLENFYTWLVDTHHEDPRRVVTIVEAVDGGPAIRVSGEAWGGFTTRERYRDYRLVVEFRWGLLTWGNRKNASRDSGILLHCQGRDGNTRADFNGPWMRSIEAQIIEGGVGDFILVAGFDDENQRKTPSASALVKQDRDGEWVYDPWSSIREFAGGRINWYDRDPDWQDVLGFRGKRDVESSLGGWTQMEVLCQADHITNIVNGTVVNQLSGATQSEGKIMFQSEGAEIFFRRIELHPLD